MTLKLLLAGKKIADFQVIKDAFSDEDAVIITATSMALSLFLARKNQPDLIIAQGNLTDSDAISLFYELKNDEELKLIPFILFMHNIKDQTGQLNISKNDLIKNGTYPLGAGLDISALPFVHINSDSEDISNLKEKILALLISKK